METPLLARLAALAGGAVRILPRHRHQAIFGEQAQRTASSLLLALIRSSDQDVLTKTRLPSQSYDLDVSKNTIKV